MSTSIDLKPRHHRIVNNLLNLHVPDSEVWAYGSRVTWRSHPASDLDLVVFVRTDQVGEIAQLRSAFAESNLPFTVDVHIWDRLPLSFHEEIAKNYVILQEESSKSTCVTLGDFAPFAYGKSLPAIERNSMGSVPVFGSNGIVGWHDRALTEGPTVVVGRKGTVGAVHWSPVPCWPIDTTFYIEGADPDTMRYKYYLLKSRHLDQMNADSAVPGLNRSEAHSIRIDPPDELSQRQVDRVLGALDDRIELNRRMCETLESMAQALFKSWFEDFDPVRAKMEGRDTGLPDHLADLFPDRLVPSELGPIPEGWCVKTLGDVMELNPRRSIIRDKPAPYLAMADMPTDLHCPVQVKHRSVGSGVRFTHGDTLVARITPCLENGKTAFVSFLSRGQVGWGSTECIVLHPRPPLPLQYAYFLSRTFGFRDYAVQAMTGSSGRQRVSASVIADYEMVEPSPNIARAFGTMTTPLLGQTSKAIASTISLSRLRDVLLPNLVGDDLRLSV